MPWNPEVYNKFKQERFAPFYDLLALINVRPGLNVIDLGCGTGELTRQLTDHLPTAQVLGIDASSEMLKEAKTFKTNQLNFEQRSIEQQIKEGLKYDLVFSNAALQWLENHETLIPTIITMLQPGGQLVVQVPSNQDHFTHRFIRTLAQQEPYCSALNGWIRSVPVLNIESYANLLFDHGGSEIIVFEKVYPHILKDTAALFDWVSGTALIPYLEKLPEKLKTDFIATYKIGLAHNFQEAPVFYPFKRILMVATFN
ncbi:trans-aconitate 2-methyltransferase [Pedobacter sp. AK017]|uniref:methyltransferase domain-containing protein n=1 Tax=Pedobacter sp. AK017 TaxID=2723073 RepID=UPI00160C2F6E|nr:methyltransferase domain-containing protein [Pedobacter sp. AK017]MBB5439201.1 trans-aconitate 2-methyltransferase [Pedobacter sp. AK017]